MFQIDSLSRQPVYEQLIEQMERFILSGVLRAGDQLPSVRSLSVELSINPNTIQKAYGELDTRGIIYSIPGIGCFVAENAIEVLSLLKRRKLGDFKALASEMLLAGVSADELIDIVRSATNGGVNKHD
ncbi:MAG: GntR family transcriptional regulator [Clostridia bacterium]|nr:GntR family transcriptional regulator [Clostridia bacterium]